MQQRILSDGTNIDYRTPHMQLINSSYARLKDKHPEPDIKVFEEWVNTTLNELARELGYYCHVNGQVIRRIEIEGDLSHPYVRVYS